MLFILYITDFGFFHNNKSVSYCEELLKYVWYSINKFYYLFKISFKKSKIMHHTHFEMISDIIWEPVITIKKY